MSSTINDLKTPSSDTRLVLYKDITSGTVQTSDLYNAVKPYEGQNKLLVFEVLQSVDSSGGVVYTSGTMSVDTFISVYNNMTEAGRDLVIHFAMGNNKCFLRCPGQSDVIEFTGIRRISIYLI